MRSSHLAPSRLAAATLLSLVALVLGLALVTAPAGANHSDYVHGSTTTTGDVSPGSSVVGGPAEVTTTVAGAGETTTTVAPTSETTIVRAASGTLPVTGGDLAGLALIGVGVIAVGSVLVRLRTTD